MTDRDPALEPTAAEWTDQFLGLPRPKQLATANRVLDNQWTAANCFLHNHANRLNAAEQELTRLRRATPPARDELVDRITLRDRLEAVDQGLAAGITGILDRFPDANPATLTNADGHRFLLEALAARGQVLAALAQLTR